LPPPFDLSEISAIVADLERAVEREPDRARAWVTLSNIHLMRGEVERAANAGRRALEVDAYIEDAPAIYRNLIASSLYRQQIDSASAWCARGRREIPTDWWFTECALTIMKYDLAGRPDAARAWSLVSRLDSMDPPALAASAGHSYAPVYRRLVAAAVSARAGDTARAMSELARQRAAAASDPELQLDMIPDEITLLLLTGGKQAALERLRWAIERRPLLGGLIAQDPILGPLAREVVPADGMNNPRSLPIPR
jgi:tetratricopeptide (TPR) repeat protein